MTNLPIFGTLGNDEDSLERRRKIVWRRRARSRTSMSVGPLTLFLEKRACARVRACGFHFREELLLDDDTAE